MMKKALTLTTYRPRFVIGPRGTAGHEAYLAPDAVCLRGAPAGVDRAHVPGEPSDDGD